MTRLWRATVLGALVILITAVEVVGDGLDRRQRKIEERIIDRFVHAQRVLDLARQNLIDWCNARGMDAGVTGSGITGCVAKVVPVVVPAAKKEQEQ